MKSFIYRSERKADCYVFLNSPIEDFELPEPVTKVVGDLTFVMNLDISENTKLEQSDPAKVLEAFDSQGFYIQMPSKEPHPVDVLFDKLFD